MSWSLEELRIFLSESLVAEKISVVVDEIRRMQDGYGVTQAHHEDYPLQGDIFESVSCVVRSGEAIETQPRRVMLVSNSCDADPRNERAFPLSLTVAPALRVSRFRDMLADREVAPQVIEDILSSIMSQEKSNIVFLKKGDGIIEDLVVLLDQVQSMTAEEFNLDGSNRIAVLTQRGFWLLVLKLSMHYCRPHEGVDRSAA